MYIGKSMKSLLSLLLTLTFVLSLGTPALANDENNGQGNSGVIEASVTVVTGEGMTTVTVGESSQTFDGTESGSVGENVSYAPPQGDAPATVTVSEVVSDIIGPVLTVTAQDSDAAIAVEAADVSGIGENSSAVKALALEGGEISVTAGDVEGVQAGVEALAENSGEINITVDSATADGTAVFANAGASGDVEITVGDVENADAGTVVEAGDTGVSTSSDGGEVTVKVAGDVEAGKEGASVYNVGGEAAVEVTGGVEAGNIGINVLNEQGGTVVIDVEGDVKIVASSNAEEALDEGQIQEENVDSAAIKIINQEGETDVDVGGDVEGGNIGINVLNEQGTVVIDVEGDVKIVASSNAEEALDEGQIQEENVDSAAIKIINQEGVTDVDVGGDVEGAEVGLALSGAGSTDLYVEGTLSVQAGGTPILLGEGVTESNIGITVWKIEIDGEQAEEGSIVQTKDDTQESGVASEQDETAQAIESSINYIIKLDPQQSGSLESDKDAAKASETVKITVTVPDGHTLKALYTDEGKTLTAQDNGDGSYTLTVPVGGGVYVHAEFTKIWYPAPSSESADPWTGAAAPSVREIEPQVSDGAADCDLGDGTERFTISRNTIAALTVNEGVKNFVFRRNNDTYTVAVMSVFAWLKDADSVTIYFNGDTLVLDFGNGLTMTVAPDVSTKAEDAAQTNSLSDPDGDYAKVDPGTLAGKLTNPVNGELPAAGVAMPNPTIPDIDELLGKSVMGGSDDGDLLMGGSGDDTLMGGSGDDTLIGGADGDALIGGVDDDALIGGVVGGDDSAQVKNIYNSADDAVIFVEGGDSKQAESNLSRGYNVFLADAQKMPEFEVEGASSVRKPTVSLTVKPTVSPAFKPTGQFTVTVPFAGKYGASLAGKRGEAFITIAVPDL